MEAESIWDDDHRVISYLIMVTMRLNLQIAMNPTVGSAYVILLKYDNQSTPPKYPLYMSLIASFLIVLKDEEKKCDIRQIFILFLKACNAFTQKTRFDHDHLVQIFGCDNLEERIISENEEKQITNCETTILHTLNFEIKQTLPFDYYNQLFLDHVTSNPENEKDDKFLMTENEIQAITKTFVQNASLFFSSPDYFQIPPIVIAAYSLCTSVENNPIPNETKRQITEIISSYGSDRFKALKEIAQKQFQRIRAVYQNSPKP